MTSSIAEQLDAAVAPIRARTSVRPRVGLVLGSGLGSVVSAVSEPVRVPYQEIPNFPTATVQGHAGELIVGTMADVPVAVLSGRVHLYEGYSAAQAVFPVRVLGHLGVDAVIVTNASGGIRADFRPEDVMVIRDHINLTGTNPLVGPNPQALGVRFPDMSAAYDFELAKIAHRAAASQELWLKDGVYAGVLGPSFETPAEIRMLRTLGADAVGMSTVLEVIALRHMGVRVLGLSCITNAAAGLSASALSHEEVGVVAQAIQSRLVPLIVQTVRLMG
ncbi:MAG: purine-nucleoside phosphorylase [Myxococcota bacterium]